MKKPLKTITIVAVVVIALVVIYYLVVGFLARENLILYNTIYFVVLAIIIILAVADFVVAILFYLHKQDFETFLSRSIYKPLKKKEIEEGKKEMDKMLRQESFYTGLVMFLLIASCFFVGVAAYFFKR